MPLVKAVAMTSAKRGTSGRFVSASQLAAKIVNNCPTTANDRKCNNQVLDPSRAGEIKGANNLVRIATGQFVAELGGQFVLFLGNRLSQSFR